MKTLVQFLGALCVLSVGGVGCSQRANTAERFAGHWEARHNGTAFFTITIKPTKPVSGTVMVAFVNADDKGNVVEARSEPNTKSDLSAPVLEGNRFSFTAKDDDEFVRYEMLLTSTNEAELRFPGVPAGYPPFKLTRTPAGN